MAGNNKNIYSFQLAAYTSPRITESNTNNFVEYSDSERQYPNNYFQYLIDRYTYSTTNKSVINAFCDLVFGKGLAATNSNKYPDQWAYLSSILKDKDTKRIIKDKKMLGMSAIQVVQKGGKVKAIKHFPMETLRSGQMNEDGQVEAWYYHPRWADYRQGDDLVEIPSYDFRKKTGESIYILKGSTPGFYYYEPVDYSGALPYSVLEDEIGDYLVNDAKNGFSGTKIINCNNGVPDEEQRDQAARNLKNAVTGSTGQKVLVSFQNGAENGTTVDDIPLTDAPSHYQYLAEECESKILKAHRCPTWLLGANSGGNGLSSNADEIKNSMLVFDNLVVKPCQIEFINAIEEILPEISLNLYFTTIQPLEFVEVDPLADSETIEEETGVKQELSKEAKSELDYFISLGEPMSDEWELIDEREVDVDAEDELDASLEAVKKRSNGTSLSSLRNYFKELFISTGTAKPNRKSEQDKQIDESLYKVRYKYTGNPLPERPFCKAMMASNKIYRKEDIQAMASRAVNPGWGPGGANTYDVWLYKGGGNCHHKWLRQTFKIKGTRGSIYGDKAEQISTNEARRQGYNPVNEKEVSMKPKDMPKQGFLK
jgi:uncharacterized Zn ribbon protein